jgi:hypothetical protein
MVNSYVQITYLVYGCNLLYLKMIDVSKIILGCLKGFYWQNIILQNLLIFVVNYLRDLKITYFAESLEHLILLSK